MIDFSDFKDTERVFYWFSEISKIPRPSGKCDDIADFLEKFAVSRGLWYKRDEKDNIIIKKGASRGYEKKAPVILQGHTDIVAEKTADSKKDMYKDGLDLYRDGDFLRAQGTTLGADNGVAVAYMLAILDDTALPHPPIEAVFTADEEIGLLGAKGLDTSVLSGKRMINLDSDEEGIFVVGCAGGITAKTVLDGERSISVPSGYRLEISGLAGGHSGSDIDGGGANAIKLAARMLNTLGEFTLAEFSGGGKDNAIPRGALADFFCEDISALRAELEKINAEYAECERNMSITLKTAEFDLPSFDTETSRRLVSMLCEFESGVLKMSEDADGLVESSVNIGVIETGKRGFTVRALLRSSKDCEKYRFAEDIRNTAEKYGAIASFSDDYPGWAYKKTSELRDATVEVYRKMTGNNPTVYAIHAGLECGIFAGKIEGLDCISMGPDNFGYHTTEEHLSIPSVARVFEFLKELLKNL